jgi:prolyl-tRNA editing enzyme YbaK/EbsC (Cys-tRNA(Pro) deacylase)
MEVSPNEIADMVAFRLQEVPGGLTQHTFGAMGVDLKAMYAADVDEFRVVMVNLNDDECPDWRGQMPEDVFKTLVIRLETIDRRKAAVMAAELAAETSEFLAEAAG